jgi:hypothetical protein
MSIIAFNVHKLAIANRNAMLRIAKYCTNGNYLQYGKYFQSVLNNCESNFQFFLILHRQRSRATIH